MTLFFNFWLIKSENSKTSQFSEVKADVWKQFLAEIETQIPPKITFTVREEE